MNIQTQLSYSSASLARHTRVSIPTIDTRIDEQVDEQALIERSLSRRKRERERAYKRKQRTASRKALFDTLCSLAPSNS